MKIQLRTLFIKSALILGLTGLVKTSNAQALCDSLFYPCRGSYSGTGFFFDLEAGANNVLIESISTMTQNAGARTVEMYYKTGTTVGFESNSGPWTLIGSASGFSPLDGINCPIPQTTVPIPVNVCIPAGQRYGFYLAMISGSGSFEAHDSLTEGDTAATDAALTMYAGKAAFSTGAFTGLTVNNKTLQGGINYSCGCATGITSITKNSDLQIFPVPARNELTIKLNFPVEANSTYSIYDINGKLVKKEKIMLKDGMLQADISELPPGIFSIAVSSTYVYTRKTFVKL